MRILPTCMGALFLLAGCTGPVLPRTYENEKEGYSIDMPQDAVIDENDSLIAPGYVIRRGVSILPAIDTGSTLIAAKLSIAFEQQCPGQTSPTKLPASRVPFLVSNWSEIDGTDLREGRSYVSTVAHSAASPAERRCAILTAVIRSCHVGEGCMEESNDAVKKEALMETFDAMAASFRLRI